MAITYHPRNMLRKMAPRTKAEAIINSDLTLNQVALRSLARLDGISKAKLEEIALKVLKQYKSTYKEERAEGLTANEAAEAAANGNALLVQRIQNTVVREVAKDIKSAYRGEFYTWLPSDAKEPDPEHQLKYGKVFQVGKGEMPGDRWGCQCGMEIVTEDQILDI